MRREAGSSFRKLILARLERATLAFGGQYSIQLSYRITRLEPGPYQSVFAGTNFFFSRSPGLRGLVPRTQRIRCGRKEIVYSELGGSGRTGGARSRSRVQRHRNRRREGHWLRAWLASRHIGTVRIRVVDSRNWVS